MARDASVERIKRAYRVLAQRNHPDRNKAPGAARVMALLNAAWDTLGDADRRAKHDAWIAREEARLAERVKAPAQAQRPSRRPASPRQPEPVQDDEGESAERLRKHLIVSAGLAGLIVLLTVVAAITRSTSSPLPSSPIEQTEWRAPSPQSSTRVPVSARAPWLEYGSTPVPRDAVGSRAPNGEAWPAKPSYLKGFALGAVGGQAELVIDNRLGQADAHVKLCPVGSGPCTGHRHAWIGHGGRFRMTEILAGDYVLRYRDLSSGRCGKSEPFKLGDPAELTLTLPKVIASRTGCESVNDADF